MMKTGGAYPITVTTSRRMKKLTNAHPPALGEDMLMYLPRISTLRKIPSVDCWRKIHLQIRSQILMVLIRIL